jgi:hypothetical protein
MKPQKVGNLKIVQLLLSYGADATLVDRWRLFAAQDNRISKYWPCGVLSHICGGTGISRYVKTEYEADVDAEDDKGQTPFSIVLANGHPTLAWFLSNGRVAKHDCCT